MKVEIIYGELANLLGEHGTQALLSKTFGPENIIWTPFPKKPACLTEAIDLAYMGPMTERSQRLVLSHWMDDRDLFLQAIEKNRIFFFAGNALDLTGRTIRYEGGDTVEALGLFPFDTYCRRYDRHNEVVYATFNEMPVMGFRSQFTTHTGDSSAYPFLKVESGQGMNKMTRDEGVRYKHFFATSLLGPFLILNPDFTRWLFRQAGFSGPLPFEEDLQVAARARMEDFAASLAKNHKLARLVRSYLEKEKWVLHPSSQDRRGRDDF